MRKSGFLRVAVTDRTSSSKVDVSRGGLMFGNKNEQQNLFYLHDYRNIDKEMAWILPLLADRAALIKVQVFVLRKDAADVIGKIALKQMIWTWRYSLLLQRSGPKRRQRFWALTTSVLRTFRNLVVTTQDRKRSESWLPWELGKGLVAENKIKRCYFHSRDCRLLVSTMCAGMGCNIPDIRLTVCVGKENKMLFRYW